MNERYIVAVITATLACPACAQDAGGLAKETVLPQVSVEHTQSIAEKYLLPAATESVTRKQIDDTVNVMNTEDAFKYLPDIFVRKRHIGDTQAPISTRTSGVGSSARSLIFADGVLLSPLIANNNTIGGPRYGMVAPQEIARIDVLYGPYSAAYAGNSMGAVVEITTRMPTHFEASVAGQTALQRFSQYGTSGSYQAQQGSVLLGNRVGGLSWWAGIDHLDSHNQPLTYITAVQPAAASGAGTPVSGAYADRNRSGAPIQVLGAGAIEHNSQDNFKFKLAYDFPNAVQAAYTVSVFRNDTHAGVQSYIKDAAGNSIYSGSLNVGGYNYVIPASAFSNNEYTLQESHLMQSISLKSNMQNRWDWSAIASHYSYDESTKRMPLIALPVAASGGAGTIEKMDGTGWSTLDLKGYWRPQGPGGVHQASFGFHYDRYVLADPKFNTANWITGDSGTLASSSLGKTQTSALWAQDVWRLTPTLRATLGGRYESWRAFDGYNFSAAPALAVNQQGLSANRFSPKLSLSWAAADDWLVTGSLGTAYRFPTVAELYQAVTAGAVLAVPNPNLNPEHARSGELSLERLGSNGRIRLTMFQENVTDALISQTAPITPGSATLATFVQNVDRTRSTGIELVGQRSDVLLRGLDVSGSVIYVNARIVEDSALVAAVGKRLPQVPAWRATLVATYHASARTTATLAGRYSSRVYATVDNSDTVTHTYQGFDNYFVADARVRFQLDKQWSAAVGVDNLFNRDYFVFHPFPQRTAMAEMRFDY